MQFQGLGITKIKRSSHNEIRYDYSLGADDRTRTCTSKTEEPKSTESTNSTTSAYSYFKKGYGCAAGTMCLPVAVPDKIFGLTHFLDFIDRCHSLGSLFPIRKGAIAPGNRFVHDSLRSATPPAALGSLPTTSAFFNCAF